MTRPSKPNGLAVRQTTQDCVFNTPFDLFPIEVALFDSLSSRENSASLKMPEVGRDRPDVR